MATKLPRLDSTLHLTAITDHALCIFFGLDNTHEFHHKSIARLKAKVLLRLKEGVRGGG